MVFESLLAKIVLSKAGLFLTGINKENFKVSFLNGDVVIKDVGIQHNIFDKMD